MSTRKKRTCYTSNMNTQTLALWDSLCLLFFLKTWTAAAVIILTSFVMRFLLCCHIIPVNPCFSLPPPSLAFLILIIFLLLQLLCNPHDWLRNCDYILKTNPSQWLSLLSFPHLWLQKTNGSFLKLLFRLIAWSLRCLHKLKVSPKRHGKTQRCLGAMQYCVQVFICIHTPRLRNEEKGQKKHMYAIPKK